MMWCYKWVKTSSSTSRLKKDDMLVSQHFFRTCGKVAQGGLKKEALFLKNLMCSILALTSLCHIAAMYHVKRVLEHQDPCLRIRILLWWNTILCFDVSVLTIDNAPNNVSDCLTCFVLNNAQQTRSVCALSPCRCYTSVFDCLPAFLPVVGHTASKWYQAISRNFAIMIFTTI